MKKTTLTIIFLSLIIGLLIIIPLFRNESIPNPEISYEYTTDTVYINQIFKDEVPDGVNTDPITIIRYKTDSLALDSLNILIDHQNLIITGLKDSITIHHYYLKQFPSNPKLLSIILNRDTLTMGLLPISGQIEERDWPIDLHQWSYAWNIDSELSRHPTPLPPTQDKPFAEYFVGGGVDIVWLSPYISGRIEKNWSRFRLYGDAHIGLLKMETHGVYIGLDYKINGTSINRKW